MKKNILLILFLILNLGLLYSLKKQSLQKNPETINYQPDIADQVNAMIADKYWWERCSEQQVIQPVNVSNGMENDSVDLTPLIGKSPKLILRYSELHCDVCVDSTIHRFNKVIEKIGKKNIIILSSYSNPRDMYTFKRLNEIELPFYNLGTQSLSLKAEQADVPYFFVVDENMKATMVFLAYKELPGELEKYFSILSKTIFNTQQNANYQTQS